MEIQTVPPQTVGLSVSCGVGKTDGGMDDAMFGWKNERKSKAEREEDGGGFPQELEVSRTLMDY